MMETPSRLARLGHDRIWILGALGATTALAWAYLISLARGMDAMPATTADAMTTVRMAPWSGTDFGLTFLMWAVMMVGMMLPSATPMILLYALVNRRKLSRGLEVTSTGVFAAGYVAAWTAFSLGATVLQGILHWTGSLSPMMTTTSAVAGGLVLLAAGVYQWTPVKASCLRHCQSPLQFISTHWRDGVWGALGMGWRHGLYCLGCCWFLMGLLFVGGVMNLLWIAGLTVFVLAEKLWPSRWVPMTSGGVLVAWGVVVIAGGSEMLEVPALLLMGLSSVGLLVSTYFTGVAYRLLRPDTRWVPSFCRMGEQTCASIVFTREARVFGVPNSLLGQIFYVLVFLGALLGWLQGPTLLLYLIASGVTVGLGVYLSHVLLVTGVPCPLCFTSHAINLAIFLLLFLAG